MNYDLFLANQSETQLTILEYLNDFLLTYPEVERKMRFKVPFYFRKSWITYVNPIKPEGIELAFLRANEIPEIQPYLDFKKRKQVAGLTLTSINDIDEELLHLLFSSAYSLDDEVPYASKRK
jgi:hypothetical protein